MKVERENGVSLIQAKSSEFMEVTECKNKETVASSSLLRLRFTVPSCDLHNARALLVSSLARCRSFNLLMYKSLAIAYFCQRFYVSNIKCQSFTEAATRNFLYFDI